MNKVFITALLALMSGSVFTAEGIITLVYNEQTQTVHTVETRASFMAGTNLRIPYNKGTSEFTGTVVTMRPDDHVIGAESQEVDLSTMTLYPSQLRSNPGAVHTIQRGSDECTLVTVTLGEHIPLD